MYICIRASKSTFLLSHHIIISPHLILTCRGSLFPSTLFVCFFFFSPSHAISFDPYSLFWGHHAMCGQALLKEDFQALDGTLLLNLNKLRCFVSQSQKHSMPCMYSSTSVRGHCFRVLSARPPLKAETVNMLMNFCKCVPAVLFILSNFNLKKWSKFRCLVLQQCDSSQLTPSDKPMNSLGRCLRSTDLCPAKRYEDVDWRFGTAK